MQYLYSPYPFLYISFVSDRENLFNNQQLLQMVIIVGILVTLLFDSGSDIVWFREWYCLEKLDASHSWRLKG